MLTERIAAFVRGGSQDRFEDLALEVFRQQLERDAVFRQLCERRGATAETVTGWREIPAMPVAGAAGEDGGADSPVGDSPADLKRAVIDHTLPAACLAGLDRPPLLSLVPPEEPAADPAVAFLAEHVLRSWAAPDSLQAAARRGVEAAKARSFLAARQRDRRAVVVLATSATLDGLLVALDRRGLRFRLPPASRVVVMTGGQAAAPDLLARLAEDLGVPPEAVVRGYGIEEQVSRFYAGHGPGGQPRPLTTPPWVRVRIVDPETRAEVAAGSEGAVAVFDLASPGRAAHLLSEDRGVAAEGGFRLTG